MIFVGEQRALTCFIHSQYIKQEGLHKCLQTINKTSKIEPGTMVREIACLIWLTVREH